MNRYQEIVQQYERARERVEEARRHVSEVGLDTNRPVWMWPSRRLIAAYERGDEEFATKRAVINRAQMAAIIEFETAVREMNRLYRSEEYRAARVVIALAEGKTVKARYDGVSAISGKPFPAGTEIKWTRKPLIGSVAAPVEEVEAALADGEDEAEEQAEAQAEEQAQAETKEQEVTAYQPTPEEIVQVIAQASDDDWINLVAKRSGAQVRVRPDKRGGPWRARAYAVQRAIADLVQRSADPVLTARMAEAAINAGWDEGGIKAAAAVAAENKEVSR